MVDNYEEINLSIIMPAYNAENTIERAINSLLKYNGNDFEIVVINDGSTDSTDIVVEKLMKKSNKIKTFKTENGGVSRARNLGIKESKGKYIAFLDSDDFHLEGFIEKMLQKALDNNLDFVLCGSKIDNGTNVSNITVNWNRMEKNNIEKLLADYINRKVLFPTATWMIKKQLLDENNILFLEDMNWAEDFAFFSDVIINSINYDYIPEYLMCIDDHRTGNLSSLKKSRFDFEINAMTYISNQSKSKGYNIDKYIFGYRIPATIIYGILSFHSLGKNIAPLYIEYEEHISKISSVNGLRSIKLWLNYFKMKKIVKKETNNMKEVE